MRRSGSAKTVRSAYGNKCRRKKRERKSEEDMDRQNRLWHGNNSCELRRGRTEPYKVIGGVGQRQPTPYIIQLSAKGEENMYFYV